MADYCFQICRLTKDPDSLDVRKDYYMGDEGWGPNYLAFRYNPEDNKQLQQANDIICDLVENNTDSYVTYYPIKSSLTYLET